MGAYEELPGAISGQIDAGPIALSIPPPGPRPREAHVGRKAFQSLDAVAEVLQ